MNGPCMCGDPYCPNCLIQLFWCSVCGYFSAEWCEDCPSERAEFEREDHNDCVCDPITISAKNMEDAEAWLREDQQAVEYFGKSFSQGLPPGTPH